MRLSDMLQSKYLKQSDVVTDCTVTVEALKKTNVARDDDAPEYKFVLKFEELDKPMVLNSTNTKRLFAALGPDSDDWLGRKVELYVDENVEYGGQTTGGLRIRAIPPANRQARRAPMQEPSGDTLESDVPF